MTRRQEIESRKAWLNSQISAHNAELAELNNELSTSPESALDRDTQAEVKAAIERKNAFLRRVGLLPAEA